MIISWFEKNSKISWIIVILIAIIIYYVSSLSFPPGKATFPWKSIAYHFYAFLFLSAFLLIATTKGENKKLIPITIILALIYAISDEIHQLFVPTRSFAISDILTDSAGILSATLIYVGIRYNEFKEDRKFSGNDKIYY
jgi:VanZ family protein